MIEAMQLYAAQFAEEMYDQFPKIADPSDRIFQEILIGHFYKGLHPDFLRDTISHFKVSNIKQVFSLFRENCNPLMVAAANSAYLEVHRKQESPRRLRLFPRELDHSSECARYAKKVGSVLSEDKRGFDKPPY